MATIRVVDGDEAQRARGAEPQPETGPAQPKDDAAVGVAGPASQPSLWQDAPPAAPAPRARRLTLQQLEAHLWGAANILRGKTAGQDYKNYILTLMFYKRLCDQWTDEVEEGIAEHERRQRRQLTEQEKAILRARNTHRFDIPQGARWGDVMADAVTTGQTLTKSMRAVANANPELNGVFTVDWALPAPGGAGALLIPNEVVFALVQHFNAYDLSNASVQADVLGRAYEFLIKKFADDAGAKAGEFFTPPEVVDTLVRILQPRAGDTVYDPTCGSGGMLVHAAGYLREQGNRAQVAQYRGQELNWSNAAIAKINSVLHGLEARIEGGYSTIATPRFAAGHQIQKFSLVLANFPFSDEFWWLRPEEQNDDKKKRDQAKKRVFGKDGYVDPYGRFGRGTPFRSPPAGTGDFAYILHIVASLTATGRAGVVCPQGVLFRGQPEREEETGEVRDDGTPVVKRRKADDEHLIRQKLLDARLIDAVISLPLNIFYGAGVPACLLILRKDRPAERRDQVLLIYAARDYRELSNQNELRPQDVMRMLVHYHAYGDAAKVPGLIDEHSTRLRKQIQEREEEEVGRLLAEYEDEAARLARIDAAIRAAESERGVATTKAGRLAVEKKLLPLHRQRTRPAAKVAERDEKIAESRRRAEEDRRDVSAVGDELLALYGNADELLRHARVVSLDEVAENEFNLNVPRYVDTFEPEPRVEVADALRALRDAEAASDQAKRNLLRLLSASLSRSRHWPIRRVDEVAEVGSGITLGKDVSGVKYVELPYLRVANVQDGRLDLSSVKTVRVRASEVDRYRLEPGDVLMTEGGDIDKLGRGAVWEGQIPDCLHQNHVFRVRANPELLDPRYFSCIIESEIGKRYFMRVAKRTTNLASTNKTQVRAFRFPVPPLAEQRQIADIIAALKARSVRLQDEHSAIRQLRDALMNDLIVGRAKVESAEGAQAAAGS